MKALKNKKGMAYVLTCVLVMVGMMMVSVLFQYRYVRSIVMTQKEAAQMELDSVILKSAVEHYDALKQGSAYQGYINYTKLEQDAYDALGFDDTDEDQKYRLQNPQITPITEGGFGLTVTYDLVILFYALGENYGNITVPVTVSSQFTEK